MNKDFLFFLVFGIITLFAVWSDNRTTNYIYTFLLVSLLAVMFYGVLVKKKQDERNEK